MSLRSFYGDTDPPANKPYTPADQPPLIRDNPIMRAVADTRDVPKKITPLSDEEQARLMIARFVRGDFN